MEDVRTEVVVAADWPTYIKDNFKNLNNGREVAATMQHQHQHQHGHGHAAMTATAATKTSNMRRSMDNLLKVDTAGAERPFMRTHSPPFGGSRAFQVRRVGDTTATRHRHYYA